MLYRIAKEVGATKIALGHHADDFIETLLLNLFFAGALKAMPAKLVSDDGAHVVIRPLVYVGEDEARAYAKECELPIIGCCCPACGDLGLQRQRVKRLLMELEREHPGRQAVDAEGARQRRAAAPARHAPQSAAPNCARAMRRERPSDRARVVGAVIRSSGRAMRRVRLRADRCASNSCVPGLDRMLRQLCVVRHPRSGRVRRPAAAQQRPLVTEDPEPIGAGRVLIEGGIDYAHDQQYPVSGLKGNLWRVPTIGVSVGLSSIAEFQIDGGFYNQLSITERAAARRSPSLVTVTGDTTHDVEDLVVATKIRVLPETAEPAGRSASASRRKLPNASNESGLGLDTTDFYASLLGAKTVQSIRVVGNLGVGILRRSDGRQPAERRADLRPVVRARADAGGRAGGRVQRPRRRRAAATPFPGTESRGTAEARRTLHARAGPIRRAACSSA